MITLENKTCPCLNKLLNEITIFVIGEQHIISIF